MICAECQRQDFVGVAHALAHADTDGAAPAITAGKKSRADADAGSTAAMGHPLGDGLAVGQGG